MASGSEQPAKSGDKSERVGWSGDPAFAEVPMVMVLHQGDGSREKVLEALSDCELVEATCIEDMLVELEGTIPDAIILGDDLGDQLAFDLCRLLRDREGFELVPVVMVSSEKKEERMRSAVEAGVDEVIFCPFTVTELWIRVRNMVRSRLYLRQVEEKNEVLNAALADLKESEAMLAQAEKLTQLGEMSAGIVHEINNPLNYSHTAMFMLGKMLEDLEGEQREDFEDVVGDIRDGLDRVNQIVKDLRAFATKSGDVSTELNLAKVVQTAVRLLGHKLSNISFDSEVAEEILIRGNENQLCQVILNLIKNGVEATEMANRSLEESCLSVIAEETEEKVHLRIRDNGTGISEEAKAKVFAPFFSTKGKGKGMGLGLSICVRIMEEHGGCISVDSEEGSFTEFTLSFPVVEERGTVAA